jgi:hypothetical protein
MQTFWVKKDLKLCQLEKGDKEKYGLYTNMFAPRKLMGNLLTDAGFQGWISPMDRGNDIVEVMVLESDMMNLQLKWCVLGLPHSHSALTGACCPAAEPARAPFYMGLAVGIATTLAVVGTGLSLCLLKAHRGSRA